ncbi:hypothetical protein BD626DRAFT_634656 [Schizophyllum amplum]|uniref:Uncharacterized protein n=1 Tax=Schizophyllum amplum TaxID=97359 RepID=A0A550BYX2_9AGAR|nr:hypothetical protein BD626DRAFT_634656 [Auriculariopsis ampla]
MDSTPDYETAASWVALMKQRTISLRELLNAGPSFQCWLWHSLGAEQAINVLLAKMETQTEHTATPLHMSEEPEEEDKEEEDKEEEDKEEEDEEEEGEDDMRTVDQSSSEGAVKLEIGSPALPRGRSSSSELSANKVSNSLGHQVLDGVCISSTPQR